MTCLSGERQEQAAQVLERIVEAGDEMHALTDEERRLVREDLDDLDAERLVSDADLAAFRNHHRK